MPDDGKVGARMQMVNSLHASKHNQDLNEPLNPINDLNLSQTYLCM